MVYSYTCQEPWWKPLCFLNMWNLVISTIRLNYNWIQSNVCHKVRFLDRNVLFGPCVRSATVTCCAHEICCYFETKWWFLTTSEISWIYTSYGKEIQQKTFTTLWFVQFLIFSNVDVASVQNPKWATPPLTTKFPNFYIWFSYYHLSIHWRLPPLLLYKKCSDIKYCLCFLKNKHGVTKWSDDTTLYHDI